MRHRPITLAHSLGPLIQLLQVSSCAKDICLVTRHTRLQKHFFKIHFFWSEWKKEIVWRNREIVVSGCRLCRCRIVCPPRQYHKGIISSADRIFPVHSERSQYTGPIVSARKRAFITLIYNEIAPLILQRTPRFTVFALHSPRNIPPESPRSFESRSNADIAATRAFTSRPRPPLPNKLQ